MCRNAGCVSDWSKRTSLLTSEVVGIYRDSWLVPERDLTRRAMIAVEKAKSDFEGNDQMTAGVISGVK
jgi:hypothetical protein